MPSKTSTTVEVETQLKMLATMLRIRAFETAANQLYLSAKMPGLTHLYIGEEAVAVGVCSALRVDDVITSTHRGHGHCIAKGADVRRMFCELLGKAEGYCRGKGGSMHIADHANGNLGANAIVGGSAGIATGAAFSAQRLGTDRVVACFFGDGALGQGLLYEVMNMAALWKLPVIYVCENNQYAESFPAGKAFATDDIASRAIGYGMPGVNVDARDVRLVYAVAGDAIARARAGGGPSLIVAESYRHEGHYYGDPQLYRTKEEIEAWRTTFDPIINARAWLTSDGVATAAEIDAVDREVDEETEAAIAWAETGPLASPITPEEIYASY